MTRWLIVSALLTAAALAASLYVWGFAYDRLPNQVPIHWGISGQPDGWIAKQSVFWVFLLVPASMAGIILLTLVLPGLSPPPFDVERFRGTYGYLMTLVVALVGYIHVLTLLGSLQQNPPLELGRWLTAGIFIFLALAGNVLGRLRRNFWLGVRTPWTLASEPVWIGTHRFSAWVFVAGGLVGFLAVAAGAPLAWCFVGLMVVIVALPLAYSLVLYKRLQAQGRL